jgi:hypothetical protein
MRCSTLAQVVDFSEFSVAIPRGARGLRELAGSRFGHTVMQRRVARAGSVPTRRRGPEARRQSKQERIHDKVSRPKTIAGFGLSPDPVPSRFSLRSVIASLHPSLFLTASRAPTLAEPAVA